MAMLEVRYLRAGVGGGIGTKLKKNSLQIMGQRLLEILLA